MTIGMSEFLRMESSTALNVFFSPACRPIARQFPPTVRPAGTPGWAAALLPRLDGGRFCVVIGPLDHARIAAVREAARALGVHAGGSPKSRPAASRAAEERTHV